MTIKGAQGPSRAGLLLTLGVLAWAGAAQAQSLDEIIEAAVAATGGRDAIAQIETVRHTGSFTMGTDFGPIEGSLEIVIIPNQKMYQALISDLFSQRSAWDGTAAWQSDSFTGTVELTGTAAANLRNQTALDGFQAYQNPVFPDAEYAKADDEQRSFRVGDLGEWHPLPLLHRQRNAPRHPADARDGRSGSRGANRGHGSAQRV